MHYPTSVLLGFTIILCLTVPLSLCHTACPTVQGLATVSVILSQLSPHLTVPSTVLYCLPVLLSLCCTVLLSAVSLSHCHNVSIYVCHTVSLSYCTTVLLSLCPLVPLSYCLSSVILSFSFTVLWSYCLCPASCLLPL